MTRSRRQLWPHLVGAALFLQLGCASKVLVPPKIDLGSYGSIGMIEFSVDADPTLRSYATQEFLQTMQMAQPGTRVLELGSEMRVLESVGHRQLDLNAIKAIGDKYGVDTVLTGNLSLTRVKPSLQISRSLTRVNVAADVRGTLSTRMVEARSGSTVWARSARAKQSVARASIVAHGPYGMGVTDKENAHALLVQGLVYRIADDFRSHWVKQ